MSEGNRKVLVADDELVSRTILTMTLEKSGFDIISAQNGETTLRILSEDDPPRIAIIDWIMPDIDGPDLCKKIKSNPKTKNIYIIMVTSKRETDDVVTALESGADDFISKPVNIPILRSRINVGFRMLDLQDSLSNFGSKMELLAQQRAEQLTHADRMSTLGLLSAGIAHEINNPTSFLAINIQTIEQYWENIKKCITGQATSEELELTRKLVEEVPAMFKEMKSGITRIKEIVDGLKTFSRTDDSKEALVSVNDCIEKALMLCANRLKYGLTVKKDLAANLPMVKSYTNQLEQVIVNLIINAVDAIESDKTIATKEISIQTAQQNNFVNIIVKDSGPGIPDDKLQHLFQPFYTTKPPGKGTGLGLYICQDIINNLGGEIRCNNKPPTPGAEFFISLPLQLDSKN